MSPTARLLSRKWGDRFGAGVQAGRLSLKRLPMPPSLPNLSARLLDALPQTQCTRCGYPDCASYADAMANGNAEINRCPPGGSEGIERLAALTGRPALALDPAHGAEGPRSVAFINEDWCIGCTLCVSACPTDAIIGSAKRMHTVIEAYCTGCELCLPVCPVDCILLESASGDTSGWSAWPVALAHQARERYQARTERQSRADAAGLAPAASWPQPDTAAEATKDELPTKADAAGAADARQAAIEAAMARARSRRASQTAEGSGENQASAL